MGPLNGNKCGVDLVVAALVGCQVEKEALWVGLEGRDFEQRYQKRGLKGRKEFPHETEVFGSRCLSLVFVET